MLEKNSKVKRTKANSRGWIALITPYILVTSSLVVAVVFVIIASGRQLTSLEGALLQAFTLGAGIMGSFVFGKQFAREAAKELIKPHARSAFRRLLSLYRSLSRLGTTIEAEKHKSSTSSGETNRILDKLEAIVIEQIATADDALEDWRDLVPEDVEELIQKFNKVRNVNE